MFLLNPRLDADTFLVADLKISRLLLMNDSNYPWFILVPRKPDLVELTDLEMSEQIEVLQEINWLGKILKENFGAEKLNIAALGNVVKQLHIHVIGRTENDAVFPKPVWGNSVVKPYEKNAAELIIQNVKSLLPND
jgi:diadenosine tetraphosphate (Ap4A) HIT family hydrolase